MKFLFSGIKQHGQNARFSRLTARPRFRRPIARPQLESLESRRLLSVNVVEYPAPGTSEQGIVSAPDGNLWFTEPDTGKIGEINPTTHVVNEFALHTSTALAQDITTGPDGNLWFTEESANAIGEMNLTTHAIQEFPITTTVNSNPVGITAGPDGNLWFTELGGNKIGNINPTTKVIQDFPIPTQAAGSLSITAGSDGNLWFTEGNKIGRINPTTDAIKEFPLPNFYVIPHEITSGPDGNLWFTSADNEIGRLIPTTQAVTLFPLPPTGSDPQGITARADGNLWFTERLGNNVDMLNLTTDAITEFPVPTPVVGPQDITSGPDGNLWFTEMGYTDFSLPNYPTVSNIGHVLIAAVNAPDLAISGTAPSSVAGGSNVTYDLTVTNNGSGVATGITLTDGLPANVTLLSSTGGVTSSPNVLSFSLGSLAPGASTSVSIVVNPNGDGTFADIAQVTMAQYDPTPSDNSVTLTTNVNSATADLHLSGTVPRAVRPGSKITYTLTVKNDGKAEATGVMLTDDLDSGVTFQSATGGVIPQGGILTFALGNLAVGASTTVTIVVTAPMSRGTVGNHAAVTMIQTDPTPADNSLDLDTETVTVTMVGAGCRHQSTAFVVTFAEPVDPAWARNVRNYHLVALVGSQGTIRLKSAKYDATTHTVTLKPAHQPNIHSLFRFTVLGQGARGRTDAAPSLPVDQNGPGELRGKFVTIISMADLVVTTKNPAFLGKYHWYLDQQARQWQRLGLG